MVRLISPMILPYRRASIKRSGDNSGSSHAACFVRRFVLPVHERRGDRLPFLLWCHQLGKRAEDWGEALVYLLQ